MTDMQLLIDYYKENSRQGPGSDESTLKALSAIPDLNKIEKVLDIGCGTGASTLLLAEKIQAKIIAIDNSNTFLEILRNKAAALNLSDRVSAVEMSMDALGFQPQQFDLLWAEGSIYHIGFDMGLTYWKPFLKSGGYLAVSELCWLKDERPEEIERYWASGYPQMGSLEDRLKIIERSGYTYLDHFVLPENCWTDNYYLPLAERDEAFLQKYDNSEQARALVAACKEERDMYAKYGSYYSYGFFIMRKD